MGGQLLSSKVVVVEEEPRVRGIPSLPTSIAGAIGVTERGPIGKALLVNSFEEFQDRFGGFTQDSDLALAAMGFFENGGSQLWVVRTVHYNDVSDPATATAIRSFGHLTAGEDVPTPGFITGTQWGNFLAEDGDTLVVSVDGGPPQTATVQVDHPVVKSVAVFPTGFGGGEVLDVEVMEDQHSVVFEAGDQDAGQVAARLNEALPFVSVVVEDDGQVAIRSDLGGSDVTVQVVGGNANIALQFPTDPVVGGGDVAFNVEATADELAAVIDGGVAGIVVLVEPDGRLTLRSEALGPASSVQVLPESTLDGNLGFDNDVHSGDDPVPANAVRVEGKEAGAYADQVQAEVRAATSGEADEFDLAIIEDGVYRETFTNLSMNAGDDRYVEEVINDERTGSSLVRVIDQLLPAAPVPDLQTVPLAGGNDGLAGLDDNDFIGSEAGKTGFRTLDQVQDLTLLLVPGRATSAVHNAMVSYCEVVRDGGVFAILDPPANQSATGIVDYAMNTAALGELSEFAAIYWPRVLVLNPSKSVFGSADKLPVPPSGIIAGVYSRTDSGRPGGVYDPPAGIDKGRMFGVLGFETDEVLEEAKRDLVYPKRINPLTTGPGLPRYIDGSRTLKGGGNFPYVGERRGVIFIERSLKQGLQFARHKNNTEGLRAQVRRTITAFLLTQMNNGAFRSREPSKAFFVDVSDTLNTPSVIFAGKLIARVGLATNKPAEFIVLRISQDTRALEAELAAAGA